jgi:hypothetical protein
VAIIRQSQERERKKVTMMNGVRKSGKHWAKSKRRSRQKGAIIGKVRKESEKSDNHWAESGKRRGEVVIIR